MLWLFLCNDYIDEILHKKTVEYVCIIAIFPQKTTQYLVPLPKSSRNLTQDIVFSLLTKHTISAIINYGRRLGVPNAKKQPHMWVEIK